jgi:hypothetical protein
MSSQATVSESVEAAIGRAALHARTEHKEVCPVPVQMWHVAGVCPVPVQSVARGVCPVPVQLWHVAGVCPVPVQM